MAGHLPHPTENRLACIGDEWSDEASLAAVLSSWVFPHLGPEVRAAEVGSGGGRIAERVAGRGRELTCFDISTGMLEAARRHLEGAGHKNVRMQQLRDDAELPTGFKG